MGQGGSRATPRQRGSLAGSQCHWTRPQDEVCRGPDAGFPRAAAEAPPPPLRTPTEDGGGGLLRKTEKGLLKSSGGGVMVSSSPFTLARDQLFPFRTGGATLT